MFYTPKKLKKISDYLKKVFYWQRNQAIYGAPYIFVFFAIYVNYSADMVLKILAVQYNRVNKVSIVVVAMHNNHFFFLV
jgi:hypothetical protein